MTSMIYGAYGQPVALDLDDTVTFHHPIGEATQRLVPPPRRPRAVGEARIRIPRTIGIVDESATTGSLPPLVQYAARPRPVVDQKRRASDRPVVGRHRRAGQPGLFARLLALFGRGRRDGV